LSIMEIKQALEEAKGDEKKAKEILKKKGLGESKEEAGKRNKAG